MFRNVQIITKCCILYFYSGKFFTLFTFTKKLSVESFNFLDSDIYLFVFYVILDISYQVTWRTFQMKILNMKNNCLQNYSAFNLSLVMSPAIYSPRIIQSNGLLPTDYSKLSSLYYLYFFGLVFIFNCLIKWINP